MPALPAGLVAGPRFAEWAPAPIAHIACDLDGTWLGADERPHSLVADATARVIRAGLRFSFATGRLPAGLPEPAAGVEGVVGPHIVHNGAQVVGGDRPDETDAVLPLPGGALEPLVRLTREHGLYGEFYTAGGFAVSSFDARAEPSWHAITGHPDALVDDLTAPDTVIKSTLVAFDPVDVDPLVASLTALGLAVELSTAPIAPDAVFLNVMAPGVAKGAALSRLLTTLGTDAAGVLAVGDGANDVSMFDLVGTAVVVDTAPAHVVAHAHLIARAGAGVAAAFEYALGS
jgi:hydroxymethylpyrimidine pyrophosphatase-like HAD family hydrolase